MPERSKLPFNRRSFLKGAGAGAAALASGSTAINAQQLADAPPRPATPLMTKEAESVTPTEIQVLEDQRPGSDFMVDVIKSLGFEYVCANPGSSFRSLHESLLHYGANQHPEFIT